MLRTARSGLIHEAAQRLLCFRAEPSPSSAAPLALHVPRRGRLGGDCVIDRVTDCARDLSSEQGSARRFRPLARTPVLEKKGSYSFRDIMYLSHTLLASCRTAAPLALSSGTALVVAEQRNCWSSSVRLFSPSLPGNGSTKSRRSAHGTCRSCTRGERVAGNAGGAHSCLLCPSRAV